MTGCFFTGGGALLEGGVLFFQTTLTWGSIAGRGSIGGRGSIEVYTVYGFEHSAAILKLYGYSSHSSCSIAAQQEVMTNTTKVQNS